MTCVWFFFNPFCIFLEGTWKINFLMYVSFSLTTCYHWKSKGKSDLLLHQFYLYVTNKRHFLQLLGRLPDAGVPRAACIRPRPKRAQGYAGPTPFL
jgi:hypothetical protein